jgi:hypothetical protein
MIAVITDNGVGGTFLNWSLHYLSGHTDYYHAKSDKFLPLPENPVTKTNSHGFYANHPDLREDVETILPNLLSCETADFHSLYFHWLRPHQTTVEDTKFAVKNLLPMVDKTIVVWLPPELVLYNCTYKSRAETARSYHDATQLIVDTDEKWEDFISYFFSESDKNWKDLGLTSVWDRREFLALNLRPFHYKSIVELFDNTQKFYLLNAVDVWNTFDQSVHALFDYLEIKIDNGRYQNWISIYADWKKVHHNSMMFCWYFKIIIDNIINGYDFDLTKFNLDIAQEAAIQHYLIYNHNLNFKTWQLKKFKNTKQLHNLLEPNIHPLS